VFHEPVFLHLECDDYAPELMENEGQTFTIWRMIPPGGCKFFYSNDGKAHISKTDKMVKANINVNEIIVDDKLMDAKLPVANYISSGFNQKVINGHFQYQSVQCFPRYESGKFIRVIAKRVRTPWTFPISVFKDYKIDNEEVIRRCFEFDWKMVPQLKMSPEDYQKCKEIFRKAYKVIKENFRIFAAIGRTDNIFGIPWLMFNDLAYYKLKIVDGEKLTLTSADLMFKAIKGKKIVGRNSKLILIRFEFMEALFRLAIARYFDGKLISRWRRQYKA